MNVLNTDLADQGADTGMLLAASHAEREQGSWVRQATMFFKLYARMHPEGFMTEDVRTWAARFGFAEPPDNRAWGYIAKSLSKGGLIQSVGFGKQRSASCHGSPKNIWKLIK